MSLTSVREHLATVAPDLEVEELACSIATVEEAAAAHGVAPSQIAKSLTLRIGEEVVLVVARGDARLDNRKLREVLGGRVKMLASEEVERETGHPVGGVCPFGLLRPMRVLCDISLLTHEEVIPAGGSRNSAVRVAPRRLADLVAAEWVDVCQPHQGNQLPADAVG